MTADWNASSWYLLASVWGAGFSAAALLRVRRLGGAVFPYFMAAWLTAELALFHIAWQLVATLAFAAAGALREPAGQLGLGLTLLSWLGLFVAHRRAQPAGRVLEDALVGALGRDYRGEIPPPRRELLREEVPARVWLRPFSMRRPGVRVLRNLDYGDAGVRHQLDLYLPEAAGQQRPMLLQIHGGGWIDRPEGPAGAAAACTTSPTRGWVCVAANYRLSPQRDLPRPSDRREARARVDHASTGPSTAAIRTSSSSPAARRAGTSRRWSRSRQRARVPAGLRGRRHHACRPACPSTASTTSSTATACAAGQSMDALPRERA